MLHLTPAAETPAKTFLQVDALTQRTRCACGSKPNQIEFLPFICTSCVGTKQMCVNCAQVHHARCVGTTSVEVASFHHTREVREDDIPKLFPQFVKGRFARVTHLPADGMDLFTPALKESLVLNSYVTCGDRGCYKVVVARGVLLSCVISIEQYRHDELHDAASRAYNFKRGRSCEATMVGFTDDTGDDDPDLSADDMVAISRLVAATKHGIAHYGRVELLSALRALDATALTLVENDLNVFDCTQAAHAVRIARIGAYIMGSALMVAAAINMSVKELRTLLVGHTLLEVFAAVYQADDGVLSHKAHTAFEFVKLINA